MKRQHTSLVSAIALVTALCSASGALAQASSALPQAAGERMEDIVVTARRVEENIQRAPVAVTAVTAARLEQSQVIDTSTLMHVAPNVYMSQAIGDPNALGINIRGQATADNLITIDPPVALYLDNVYIARSNGGLLNLVDVERVEVLRGPQGTLFGRNSTGGAVNIVAKRPSGELEGMASARYGNFDTTEFTAVLNVPLVGDQLAFRVAAQKADHDGYGRSSITNQRSGDDHLTFIRGSLRIAPDNLPIDLTISGDYSKRHDNGAFYKFIGFFPGQAGVNVPAACAMPANAPFCYVSIPGDKLDNYVGGDKWVNQNVYDEFTRSRVGGVSANALIDLGEVSLRSITAYRENKLDRAANLSGTPYTLLDTPGTIRQEQFTQEVQLFGTSFDDRLNWIGGVFYLRETGKDSPKSVSLLPIAKTFSTTLIDATNSSIAAYGQATFSITDELRFTGGLRYTEDTRDTDITSINQAILSGTPNNLVLGPAVCAFIPAFPPSTPCVFSRKPKFDYVSYTASIDYQWTPTFFTYAKTSRASRAGGISGRAISAAQLAPYDPESITDYEVGAKADWFDGRLRTNIALYYGKYNDVQVNVSTFLAGRQLAFTQNAAKGRVYGAEFEFVAVPVDNLRLGGAVGLTRYKYLNYIDPATGADLSFNKFPRTPHETFNLNASYKIPLDRSSIELAADYSYTGSTYGSNIFTKTPSYSLVNAQITYALDSGLQLGVYARNLLDKYYQAIQGSQPNALAYRAIVPGAPRTYGVSAKYSF